MAYVAFPSRRPRRRLIDVTGVLCVSTALAVSGESSQQRQGTCRAEETGRLAVDVCLRYISCQTGAIALPGPPGSWAATAKIGSSASAEGRVLGSLQCGGHIEVEEDGYDGGEDGE
ncbi:hypothetical protein Taro_000430 [Colocasia esculenta]|uniref:Uncharacterized protein n=1 Tax=Colocasia esculenta TaxID=4460 RepID=A0A843T7Q7_COLES|nr:hypothetical protein [Colocasia esculenta]